MVHNIAKNKREGKEKVKVELDLGRKEALRTEGDGRQWTREGEHKDSR